MADIMADIKEQRAVPRIDCYSRSEFDENVEHGLVLDISQNGAGLTLLKNAHLLKHMGLDQLADSSDCLRLNIFHPDYPLENSLNINAHIAWLDHKYSNSRVRLGVQFSEMDESKSRYVNKFIDWFQTKGNYFLHCEVERCS